jgi:hypothetical protein
MSRIPNPLGDSSRESRKPLVSFDELPLYLMILPTILAAFIHLLNAARVPETPRTRDIHLTVPQESSVNAQVTSGNNTVNITDL